MKSEHIHTGKISRQIHRWSSLRSTIRTRWWWWWWWWWWMIGQKTGKALAEIISFGNLFIHSLWNQMTQMMKACIIPLIKMIILSLIIIRLEKPSSLGRTSNHCENQVGKAEFLGRATGRPHVDLEDAGEPYSSPHLEWFQVWWAWSWFISPWSQYGRYGDGNSLLLDLPRQRGFWWAARCLWAFWARRLRQVVLK